MPMSNSGSHNSQHSNLCMPPSTFGKRNNFRNVIIEKCSIVAHLFFQINFDSINRIDVHRLTIVECKMCIQEIDLWKASPNLSSFRFRSTIGLNYCNKHRIEKTHVSHYFDICHSSGFARDKKNSFEPLRCWRSTVFSTGLLFRVISLFCLNWFIVNWILPARQSNRTTSTTKECRVIFIFHLCSIRFFDSAIIEMNFFVIDHPQHTVYDLYMHPCTHAPSRHIATTIDHILDQSHLTGRRVSHTTPNTPCVRCENMKRDTHKKEFCSRNE